MQICRLYATKHLRVLLRAGVEFFSSWGMELLVTQLHDHSKTVSMEALDILDEACEDKVPLRTLHTLSLFRCWRESVCVCGWGLHHRLNPASPAGPQANLHALIQLKPALSHLGDKGLLLLLRWVLSPPLHTMATLTLSLLLRWSTKPRR